MATALIGNSISCSVSFSAGTLSMSDESGPFFVRQQMFVSQPRKNVEHTESTNTLGVSCYMYIY